MSPKVWRPALVVIMGTILICSALLIAPLAYGQSAGSTTANVNGKVIDEQGASISNTKILLRNLETNLEREVVANENGEFIVLQLPPGNYDLIAEAANFKPKTYRVELILGTTLLINPTLGIQEESIVVEVKGGNNTFNIARTESSYNVDRERIDGLPINRRNYLDFSLTAPRVVSDGIGLGAAGSSGLSFNGQSGRLNNITIDGLDNNDSGSGSVRATFSQDAVQEFQIVADNYSAEFGRALGGVVNILTRGGGNDYHGSLFFFNRNDSLSARSPFSKINPEYKQYQFGTVLSGPIKKDKAFFFASFERLSIKQNNVVTISDQSVASARRLGFNLSNGPIPFSIGTSTVLVRGDLRISPNDLFYVRYNGGFSFNSGFENFGGLVGYGNSGIQDLHDNTGALNNTYVNPGLNLVNETRFLFTRRNQDVLPTDGGPQVRITAPEGSITFGRSTFLPQFRDQRFYQFVNNTTLTRGRLQLKFGTDVFVTAPPEGKSSLPVTPGGVAIFNPLDFSALLNIPGLPSFTGLEAFDPALRSPAQRAFLTAAAALLPSRVPGFPVLPLADLALPTAYLQGFGNPFLVVPSTFSSFYVQSDYRIKENLLIKAGLRYDFNRARFIPDNSGNFSPRLSISYRPAKLPNLNIHASYGTFFSVPITGIAVAVQLSSSGQIQLPVFAFPASIIPFSLPGHKFPEGLTVPSTIGNTPQLSMSFQFDPNLRESYNQQFNFGFDYLLGKNSAVSVNYVGIRGIKVFGARDINPVVRPVASPLTSAITGRVDPTRGSIFQFESAYDSYYHSVTFSFNQKIANSLNIQAHYSFSKSIDNANDFGSLSRENGDSLNNLGERGLSTFDTRNMLVLSALWDINYGKSPLFKGFQLSTITRLSSGRPYNLLAGVDLNRNGDNPPGDRPAGLGRNVGIRPGFAQVDMRLTRTFTINEHVRIQGFFEAFNLFNRVNISDIDRTFPPDANGNFNLPPQEDGRYIVTPDRYRDAFAPRQLQLGFRLSF